MVNVALFLSGIYIYKMLIRCSYQTILLVRKILIFIISTSSSEYMHTLAYIELYSFILRHLINHPINQLIQGIKISKFMFRYRVKMKLNIFALQTNFHVLQHLRYTNIPHFLHVRNFFFSVTFNYALNNQIHNLLKFSSISHDVFGNERHYQQLLSPDKFR